MDLRSLRVLFDDGGLSIAEAVRVEDPQSPKWLLTFHRRNGEIAVIGTSRSPELAKEFSSLNAVATAAEEIGFTKLQVKLKNYEESNQG